MLQDVHLTLSEHDDQLTVLAALTLAPIPRDNIRKDNISLESTHHPKPKPKPTRFLVESTLHVEACSRALGGPLVYDHNECVDDNFSRLHRHVHAAMGAFMDKSRKVPSKSWISHPTWELIIKAQRARSELRNARGWFSLPR